MIFDVKNCKIQIARKTNPHGLTINWGNSDDIPFKDYQIKETDLRTKTATFTTPFFIDLTTGVYVVRISSIYHENFAGYILSNEYDETTGLYKYQCQDWSRTYQGKTEAVWDKCKVINIIKACLTRGNLPAWKNPTKAQAKAYKPVLSGIRSINLFDQSLYKGNIVKGNPMKDKISVLPRDKSYMDIIRDMTFGKMNYVDVWFNDKGVLQIQPLSRTDWSNTGLILSANTDRKFKFDTTNAITAGIATGDSTKIGKYYNSKDLVNLDLSAFFGDIEASVSSEKKTTNSTSKSTSKSNDTTVNNKYGNPFNNKKKRIMVSADNGSDGYRESIIKLLKKDGWSVTNMGTGSDTHSASYRNLSSKYSVNLTIYNGADPKTLDEAVTGWLKGKHEKYGVRLVQMFDTRHWTSKTGKYNKKGLWYKRHGDFKGYRVPKAWDDNYSGARGGVLIEDLQAWYIKYKNRVCYCAGTTPAEAYKQFLAGGYLKMKGLV